MDIFHVFSMLGGLALFLYGMRQMSESLEKLSGGKLKKILSALTGSRLAAVLLGAGITAVLQSSSAATVMVVGFVNAGLMSLSQAIGVIMGANIGTTVTAWLLSLAGLESGNFFIQLCKPSAFAPVLALAGVLLLLSCKDEKKCGIGALLTGFALLMMGMDMMSQAMKPLSGVPQFTALLTRFSHPLFGLLAGALVTAVIQSSSASVGILQALCASGSIPYAAALPVILGQNIGTCVTAVLSGVGAGRNAKRAAFLHLLFNLIGAGVFMTVFYTLHGFLQFNFMQQAATGAGIAALHTGFNLLTTLLLLPFAGALEKLACRLIRSRDGRSAQPGARTSPQRG